MRTYFLYDFFVRNEKVSSDGVALVGDEDSVRFHELLQRVLLATATLKEKGVGKGDCVALLSLNRSCFFIHLGALVKNGAIMVPLNWRLSSGVGGQ